MTELLSQNLIDYKLLDSGSGVKLEIISGVTCVRPCPQAIWPKRLAEKEWAKATSICVRQKDGGGHWKHQGKEPVGLNFRWTTAENKELKFLLKFTSFGHTGIFFEQDPVWTSIFTAALELKKKTNRPLRFLNLFGYTGAASLIVASLGAEVVHVDSAKGVLNWGRENQELSGLKHQKVSFIHQDVVDYLKYAERKGAKFDGILADPPSWGHGVKKGEKWEFENQIQELVDLCSKVLMKQNSFFFLSCHTHGVQHQALRNVLKAYLPNSELQAGEIGVHHANDERILPAGIFALATQIR